MGSARHFIFGHKITSQMGHSRIQEIALNSLGSVFKKHPSELSTYFTIHDINQTWGLLFEQLKKHSHIMKCPIVRFDIQGENFRSLSKLITDLSSLHIRSEELHFIAPLNKKLLEHLAESFAIRTFHDAGCWGSGYTTRMSNACRYISALHVTTTLPNQIKADDISNFLQRIKDSEYMMKSTTLNGLVEAPRIGNYGRRP